MINITVDKNKGKLRVEAIGTGLEIAADLIHAVLEIAKVIGDDGAFRKLLCAAISNDELFAQFCNAEKGETDDD